MRAHLGPSEAVTLGGAAAPDRGRTKGLGVYVGALTLDVMLGDVRSLKQKRSAVRPLIAEVNRRFPGASVAETGHLDLHRRGGSGGGAAAPPAAAAPPGPPPPRPPVGGGAPTALRG